MAPGGGYADAGLDGDYFANPTLSGTPAFSRRDVRLDFDWRLNPAGGSTAEPYRSFPLHNFSVRWTGELLPRFSELYTLYASHNGEVRVWIKPSSTAAWTSVIDSWTSATTSRKANAGTFRFQAGQAYPIRVEYRDLSGPAGLRVSWSSADTPVECIDVASGLASNAYTEGFTNAMFESPDEWKGTDYHSNVPRDANGWPLTDAINMVWQGTDGHEGTYLLQFNGQADLDVQFGYAKFENQKYDPATNTTTVLMEDVDTSHQNFNLIFKNTRRDANSATNTGVTNVRLFKPIARGSSTYYSPDNIFDPAYTYSLRRYIALRFMEGTNWNNSVNWTDRTFPNYSTQNVVHPGESGFEGNGMAWEYKIMLCNQIGKDLYINIPETASDDYITKLAQLIRYGSDGTNPYSAPTANPVFPPLNSNLRVYVEYANEVWNVGFAAFHQNLDSAVAAVKEQTDEGKALSYDGTTDENVLWNRRHVYQGVRASRLFRAVFGDDAMGSRVRMLHFWQYANYGWPPTAYMEMTYLDLYFNNGDGKPHVADPHPPSYYFWGAGGATYFGAQNEEGRTSLLSNGRFDATSVTGAQQAPDGATWTFEGSAGLVRPDATWGKPLLPLPDDGNKNPESQAAYLTGQSSASQSIAFPAQQVSNIYGVTFEAANRTQPGATRADVQTMDVYLDGVKIHHDGFSPREGWNTYYTDTFEVQPGSTHTLKFAGAGDAANGTVVIANVRIDSVDAIFAGDIPANGNGATLADYRKRLQITGDWPALYGLHFAAYEGGWALGGDMGGTPVENAAKFGDPRATGAQMRSIDTFYGVCGSLYTFGTYSQWDDWHKADDEPLGRGIDLSNRNLPAAPGNVINIPATLDLSNNVPDWGDKNIDPGRNGQIGPRTFAGWHVLAPRLGAYQLSLPAIPAGSVQILMDGLVVGTSQIGVPLRISVHLTPGPHTIRVKSLDVPIAFSQLTVTGGTVQGGDS